MDPIPSAINTLINALQNLAPAAGTAGAQAAPLPSLLALAGQDVAMMLLGQAAEGGVNLQLPSGQVITAQGQMSYPEGTQLLVRVLAGTGADAPVRLQTLQATPPAAPAILAPLAQSEASGLLASLAQPEPPPELAELAAQFRQLGGSAPAVQAQAPAPDAARIQAALPALPETAQAALRNLLGLPPESTPQTTAAALESWLSAGTGEAPAAGASRGAATPGPGLNSGAAQAPVQDPLLRLAAALEQHPELPPAQAAPLAPWLKHLLGASAPGGGEAPAPGAARTDAAAAPAMPGGPRDAAAPETWEGWIRGSVKALSDPAASPQTAPFHAAQAREGTAYFEIPLPWAPGSPLQMWVESDRDPRGAKGGDAGTQRVLLGLAFSNLGETRLGIARNAGNLQVRVWTEHPERVEAARAGMEAELEALGGEVDLKVYRLAPGPGGVVPSLRSEVAGSTLQALG